MRPSRKSIDSFSSPAASISAGVKSSDACGEFRASLSPKKISVEQLRRSHESCISLHHMMIIIMIVGRGSRTALVTKGPHSPTLQTSILNPFNGWRVAPFGNMHTKLRHVLIADFLLQLQIGLSILKTLSSVGKSAKKSQFARLNHTFGKMKIINIISKS